MSQVGPTPPRHDGDGAASGVRPRSWTEHLPAGSRWTVAELSRRGTLPDAWEADWASSPGACALVDLTGATPGGWVRAAQLEEWTAGAARRLGQVGAVPGDRVLWCVASSVHAIVANIGALRAGLVVVPANPRYTARELAHIVADVRPRVAVVDDPGRARQVEEAAVSELTVLSAELEHVGGRRPAGGSDASSPGARRPGSPALIAYTSGTTGTPKGAVLSHANLLADAEALRVAWRWAPDDRLVHVLPIFHGHGLCVGIYGSLLAGASVVLLGGFEPGAVVDACQAHGATLFFGVPTMYHRLAASGRVGELRRLRLAVSGSAPLPAALHRRIRDFGVDVLERYGMTETLMDVSNPVDGERRAGTVGFPLPGVDVSMAGDGEIRLRGPNVFSGYWERPGATAEAFADGWFRTGDLADVDGDGYVRIRGRSSELVISGGFNVYPAEVEDVLVGHPGVAEVAVTGTPSEEWGEVVTAWVVPAGAPPGRGELERWAAERLAPYKRPRLIHFVDALPRNAMGKVSRKDLA